MAKLNVTKRKEATMSGRPVNSGKLKAPKNTPNSSSVAETINTTNNNLNERLVAYGLGLIWKGLCLKDNAPPLS